VGQLASLQKWLEETFLIHGGNAAVVQQELVRQHNISVHLRTVQRAVQPLRKLLLAKAKATVRFETLPGKQMQIDFGSKTMTIAEESKRVYFFVATLGYSRRMYAQAFIHERQTAWFMGLEGAFRHFGGVPRELLLDNPRPLVTQHNPRTREVIFNERFKAFTSYWRVKPRACAPYRARTKGKDESGVKYLKRNCIAGRTFASWEELEAHLAWWLREIADVRIHGTTGERPIKRFAKEEASALASLEARPPFCQVQQFHRIVHNDAFIEVGTNYYSVPWRYIKEEVSVQVVSDELIISHGSDEIARHPLCLGRKNRRVQLKHFSGIIGAQRDKSCPEEHPPKSNQKKLPCELLRPLAEYEALVGGSW
jgi:transposase